LLLSPVATWIRRIFGADDSPGKEGAIPNGTAHPAGLEPGSNGSSDRKVRLGSLNFFRRDGGPKKQAETETLEDRLATASTGWDAILDVLFWSGYTGTGDRDTLLARIERIRQTTVNQVNTRFRVREEALRAKLDALAAQRLSDQGAEPGLRQELSQLNVVRGERRDAVQKARESLIGVFARLGAKRAQYGVRQIEERLRLETALSKQLAQNTVEIEESRTLAETALLNRELARRDRSGIGYETYRGRLEERARLAREQMERQASLVGVLRASGMTERVTGFLVWAGYLGLAAFGWRLGEVLHLLTLPAGSGPGTVSNPATLIPFLADNIYNTFLELGFRMSLAAIAAFVTLWLLGSYLILRMFDSALAGFDDRWDPDRRRRVRAKRKREADKGNAEKRSDEEEHAPAPHRTLSRRPSRAARSQSIGFRELVGAIRGDTDRSDYIRYLARTPLIAVPVLLSLLVLLFFAVGKQKPQGAVFRDPLNSLLYLLVGLTAAAAITGFVCLLVQPVVYRVMKTARPDASGDRLSLAVLLLPLATIAVAGSAAVRWESALWGATAPGGPLLLLGVNAVVLAHGLVYRSVQRDFRALKRESEIYEARLWSLNPYHVIQPSDLQPWSLHERWANLQEELTTLWDLQDGRLRGEPSTTVVVHLATFGSGHPAAASEGGGDAAEKEKGKETEAPRRKRWWEWWSGKRPQDKEAATPQVSTAQKTAAKIADDLTRQRDALLKATSLGPMDLRLEPELSAELLTAQSTFGEAHALLAETDARIAELRDRIEEVTGTSVDDEIARIDGRLRRIAASRERLVAKTEARYASVWQEGAGAYEAGKKLAQRVAKISANTIRP